MGYENESRKIKTKNLTKGTIIGSLWCLFAVGGVIEGGADGGAVLRVLGDVETDVVKRFEGGEHLFTLREQGEVAYEHEIAYIAAYGGEPGG